MIPKLRRKIFRVQTFIFLEFLKRGTQGFRIVSGQLPEDTKFITAGHDHTGTLFLQLESSEFDEIEEGAILPELPSPEFEKIFDKSE